MQTPHAIQATPAPTVPGAPSAPGVPGEVPVSLVSVPEGGGRLIIEKQGDRTVFTTAALPPEFMQLTQRVQETAFAFLAVLVVVVVLGPFARMWARRLEKRPELERVDNNAQLLQQQLFQLQQSMDAMSVEVERISESQRFQSRLMGEKRTS